MNLSGRLEAVVEKANVAIDKGATVYFKFTCSHCGSRQTFDVPNALYEEGKCEECGVVTRLLEEEIANVGFMVIYGL